MRSNTADRKRSKRWGLLLLALLFGAGAAGIFALQWNRSAPAHDPPISTPPAASKRWTIGRMELPDSGYLLAYRFATRTPHDPTSLESIRNAYHNAGYRGIDALRLQPALPREDKVDRLLQIALLYGYEGDFGKASATLDEARSIVEGDSFRSHRILPSLVFLQGLMALRRGEVENCVEHPCPGCCIFPLQPCAFHKKSQGSRQAIKYFTEYLQGWPQDNGVRWLLNVAYMTLGEYPDRVPEMYYVPVTPLHSEFDIGRFIDLAPDLGLDRLHRAGGAIMDDFDNDGLLDLMESSSDPGEPMAFYRNQGDGTFANWTKEARLESQLGGLQCLQTDYNNDGWLDVFVCRGAWTEPQRPSLLRNNGNGTFTDVTREAGLLKPINTQAAAWADYDNDGWLDLFLGGETVPSLLYHNKGDGTFEEVSERAGVTNRGYGSKGANWGDWDHDGYPDLYVSNFNGPPRFYQNNRNGTFTELASSLGITKPEKGFACWFWDYDNDGWLDIFAAGYEYDLSLVIDSQLGHAPKGMVGRLYRNRDGKRFEDVTEAAGLDRVLAPMGSNFGDFDGDGFLDFYLGTGTPNYSMLTPNVMFKNVNGKRFADITLSSGTGHLQKGHGVACGDWDRNGSIDLFAQMGGAVPGDRSRSLLFQNPSKGNHWLTVHLVGKKSNRPAIGARIKAVLSSGQTIHRHVTSGSSFGANSLQQTLGLGTAEKIATLEIHWPTTRTTQVFHDIAADQAIEVTEFDKSYRPLHWSPLPLSRP